MPPTIYTYSEAVHFAANRVMSEPRQNPQSRRAALEELLYSLASSIPETWSTTTRMLLLKRERNVDRVLEGVASDMALDVDPYRYSVLGAILQLVFLLKNYAVARV